MMVISKHEMDGAGKAPSQHDSTHHHPKPSASSSAVSG